MASACAVWADACEVAGGRVPLERTAKACRARGPERAKHEGCGVREKWRPSFGKRVGPRVEETGGVLEAAGKTRR